MVDLIEGYLVDYASFSFVLGSHVVVFEELVAALCGIHH